MVTFVTAHVGSEIGAFASFLDTHVLQFAAFEDFAALQAFYEFSVFIAAHNLDTRMFAWWFLVCAGRERGGRLGGHKSRRILKTRAESLISPEFPVF
jgi:hypothetical protein